MTSKTLSQLARAFFGVVCLCLVASLAFFVAIVARADAGAWQDLVASIVLAVVMFAFPVVGVLVATRQPRNAFGWVLLGIGLVWELNALTEMYVRYGIQTAPGSLWRPDIVAATAASGWVPGVGLIGTFLLLLFPDGRLPSPRWRWFAHLCAFVLIALTLLIPLTPGTLREVVQADYLPETPNPLGIESAASLLESLYVILPLLPLCIVGSALSVVGRFRRSRGRERLQLKWLAAGAGFSAGMYLLAMAVTLPTGLDWSGGATPLWLGIIQNLALYSFVLIPVAVGIAILRHRLYDIDVIINRALVYGLLTVALAGVYVAGVFGAGSLVRAFSRQEANDVVVAASTLAVAALFRPLRLRVQHFIDRRFYRRKYDIEVTLSEFAGRLRDQVDLESLNADLVGVVSATMQPAHASLWLRPPRS